MTYDKSFIDISDGLGVMPRRSNRHKLQFIRRSRPPEWAGLLKVIRAGDSMSPFDRSLLKESDSLARTPEHVRARKSTQSNFFRRSSEYRSAKS